jgi:hypothetical protein
MKTKEVRDAQGNMLGWVARVGAVDGIWTEWTRSGFKIQRWKPFADRPDRAFFTKEVYPTRGAAKRALQGEL